MQLFQVLFSLIGWFFSSLWSLFVEVFKYGTKKYFAPWVYAFWGGIGIFILYIFSKIFGG